MAAYTAFVITALPVSWASGNERINVKAISATEVTDRLSRPQDGPSINGASDTKAGLAALKELLFDEMALFTITSALVLLVALIGAAVIISKRTT